MISEELKDIFRDEVQDLEKPYLWSDDAVYRYMNDAYTQFFRLTGGIADVTSSATQVDVVAGEYLADLHPSILRIMSAQLASDQSILKIFNMADVDASKNADYGYVLNSIRVRRDGTVKTVVIGAERNKAILIDTPMVNDTINLHIYRLPLTRIKDGTHQLEELPEDHQMHLVNWMKHLAYLKQDAETFDKSKSDECEGLFRNYCGQCTAEWNRYKHKTRETTYGGL